MVVVRRGRHEGLRREPHRVGRAGEPEGASVPTEANVVKWLEVARFPKNRNCEPWFLRNQSPCPSGSISQKEELWTVIPQESSHLYSLSPSLSHRPDQTDGGWRGAREKPRFSFLPHPQFVVLQVFFYFQFFHLQFFAAFQRTVDWTWIRFWRGSEVESNDGRA